MKKINYYRVEVTDPLNGGILGGEKKFEMQEFKVIGENDKYIAIDNYAFTSIRKEKCDWDTCLDKPSIHLSANDSVYGTRVAYTLYTQKTKRASTIKKEIEAAIEKKYGFFARGFDLSFIKDSNATEQKEHAA
jgi:hypothetical protein